MFIFTFSLFSEEKLSNITLTYLTKDLNERSVNIWDIIKRNNHTKYLTYGASAFYSEKPRIFSYYYKPFRENKSFNITVDESKTDRKSMNKLELFWYHVREVIANNDEKSYNYIKNWIIRPLQKPNKKNKTALLVYGTEKGTGKSWFAEIVARLHGNFGEENVGDMSHVCGKFNSLLKNKTLEELFLPPWHATVVCRRMNKL